MRNLLLEGVGTLPLRDGVALRALGALLLRRCFAGQAGHVVRRGVETGFEVYETRAQRRNLTLAARVRTTQQLRVDVTFPSHPHRPG